MARFLGVCLSAVACCQQASSLPTIRREGRVSASIRADAETKIEKLKPSTESLQAERLEEAGSEHLGEADRLWKQFRVLDERFTSSTMTYMESALRNSNRERRTAQEYLEDLGDGASEEEDSAKALATIEAERSTLDAKAAVHAAEVSKEAVTYGFYIHCFFEAAAVVHQARDIRKFYPEAPVYIMSDGGANFSGLCEHIGNCRFAWKAGAHDSWNPKPFLDRFREAAVWLGDKGAKWTIYLEPDVSLHKRASYPLTKGHAGGLYDMWNNQLPIQLRSHMEEMGRNFSGNKNFTLKWGRFGLAGGSIIRTKAILVSFKPDNIDWPLMEKLSNECVYSSDIAMLVALAAHGFDYYPWEDVHQGHDEYQPKHETAFQHHSANEGKPYYGKSLAKEDEHLVGPPPQNARGLKLGQCQHCMWVDEAECWKHWDHGKGNIECPSDQQTFRHQKYPTEAPDYNLFKTIQ